MKKVKVIFGTLLIVLLTGALGYFIGFLANLFKAFDSTHPRRIWQVHFRFWENGNMFSPP